MMAGCFSLPMKLDARNGGAMQFLVPGWKFNPQRPCLVS
jgi:hypothetical protein